MIKIAPAASNTFHSFKCGEIFCISPTVYDVTCCQCAIKTSLEHFSRHFETQHFALTEGRLNLEVVECQPTENVMNVGEGSLSVKDEGGLEDDPIKLEDLTVTSDTDYKSSEQILEITKETSIKLEEKREADDKINLIEKSQPKSLAKKPKAGSFRKIKNETCHVKELGVPDEDMLFDLEASRRNESKVKNEFDSNTEDFGTVENDMDGDWMEEDEFSKTDSEASSDNFKDELPYPCHICKKSYRSKNGLRKHDQIVHNPNRKTPRKTKGPKTEHKCDECSEVFRIARDLRAHKWKHTGIFCDICGKRFSQPGNMMRHKQRHTGIKEHKCKECGKEFFTDKELKSHLICHTGLMPVICEICGKQCRHRGVLTAHMRRHTGERPAKCDVCGKCFFSIHDLNVHAVAHTSERPFKCDICGSTFQRRKALRVHKLIHSTDRKHVCKICGKGFAQSGGLKSHLRTHNAALEKSAIEASQKPLASNIADISSSQAAFSTSGPISLGNNATNMPAVVISSESNIVTFLPC